MPSPLTVFLAGFRRSGIFIILSRVSGAEQRQNPYKLEVKKPTLDK